MNTNRIESESAELAEFSSYSASCTATVGCSKKNVLKIASSDLQNVASCLLEVWCPSRKCVSNLEQLYNSKQKDPRHFHISDASSKQYCNLFAALGTILPLCER